MCDLADRSGLGLGRHRLPVHVHPARFALRSLTNTVDEGKASYAQLMVKIVVDTSVANKIAEEIRAAGTSPAVKEV